MFKDFGRKAKFSAIFFAPSSPISVLLNNNKKKLKKKKIEIYEELIKIIKIKKKELKYT